MLEQEHAAHVAAFERVVGDVRSDIQELTKAIGRLAEAIDGPPNHPEDGLLTRVRELHQRKSRFDGIFWKAVTAGVMGLLAYLVTMSAWVQRAKVDVQYHDDPSIRVPGGR